MFVSREEFQLTLYSLRVLKRSLYFYFTTNVSKLFNVVINREYNLVWKHNRSIRNDGKGFHSPIFVLDKSHCTSSMFVSLMTTTPKCTSRWCLSTGQFFRAAKKTFTQNTIEYGLLENCSFDFKFNVLKLAKISPSSQELKCFRTRRLAACIQAVIILRSTSYIAIELQCSAFEGVRNSIEWLKIVISAYERFSLFSLTFAVVCLFVFSFL